MADTLALNDIFERNQHLMLPEVLQQVPGKNAVIDIFEKGVWPGAMGDVIDVLTVERSFADGAAEDGSDWAAVVPDSMPTTGGAVLPPEQILTTGQTRQNMRIFQKALESDNINLELIRGAHQLDKQLGITEGQFVQGVQRELEKRFLYAYRTTSSNLVCASKVDNLSTINKGSLGFPTNRLPDMELEQGFLDIIWDEMENETQGAGAVGNDEDGARIYLLLTEPTTSRGLKVNNPDIRQDLRDAYKGEKMTSPLLQPYGLGGRCYGNFTHKTYKQMPRYDWVNGALVQRNYWKKVAVPTSTPDTTGKGYMWIPDPLYQSAEWTSSYIVNTKVFKWLTPGMLNSPGGGASFETPNYFPKGIQWLNERNLDKNSNYYNPDKTIGHYRAVMAAAIEPMFPRYGWCILHKRHQPKVGTTYVQAYAQ